MQFIRPTHNSRKGVFKYSIVWIVIFLAIGQIFISSSEIAHAGLFSFLSPTVEGREVSANNLNSGQTANSQTIALLQAASNLDPNPIKIANITPVSGNILVADIALSNEADVDQSNSKISSYIVRDGDTVTGIAKMFNVSVNTVLWANGLTSKSALRTGQTLIILPLSGAMYTVKKGDTVASIAKKFKADADDIISFNDLTVSSLSVGQSIIIPDAELNIPETNGVANKAGSGGKAVTKKNLPSYSSYYLRPIPTAFKSQALHGNNGIDLAAPIGTPIFASASGTVIISRMNGAWNGGYGSFVTISHANGTQTLYSHMLSKSIVEAGEYVSQGQVIGYVGMTGKTTGPHLHFEVRGAKNPF